MIKLLLGLDDVPTPHDAADALAVALCHAHNQLPAGAGDAKAEAGSPPPRSWRQVKPESLHPRRPS
jgi:crossover junction endodeoxyribonuclease RuvC